MSYGVVPAGTSSVFTAGVHRSHHAETRAAQDAYERAPLLQGSTGEHFASLQTEQARDARAGVAGPNESRKFESLDYEPVENVVCASSRKSVGHFEQAAHSAVKWLVCLLLGICTAGAAFAVNLSVENLSGFKFWATLTLLDNRWYIGSFLLYVLINSVLVAAAVSVTVYFGPAAAGSGIAEVKAYLNGIDVPGIFLFRTLVVKLVGSVGSVAGGLAIGKEGPFVHAGACIGALLSQGGTRQYHIKWFKHFWNDRDRADIVACGSAAGVAAAFRSPVGGVLFALEETTSRWRNELLWLAFFSTAVVSVAVRALMSLCRKDTACGFFGSGGFIVYEIQEGQTQYEAYELLPMLLLGVFGGLLGSSFNSLNAKLTLWRKKRLAKFGRRGRVYEGVIISFITSGLSFLLPMIFACQQCPADTEGICPRPDNSRSGNFIRFACRTPNTYNDLATIFLSTQDDAIRNLFSSRTKAEYSVTALSLFVTFFFGLAVVTYGIAVPTGLFVPGILCGAAYGRLVGIFVADTHPTHNIDEGTYAVLGAASFLGGSMRMTVCTCVMLLELTNNLALLPLVMLVLLVAKAVGDGTGVKAIYEVQMYVKELPYLDADPEHVMKHVTAQEVCQRSPVVFERVERVGWLLEALKNFTHNGFPVIEYYSGGDGHILGVILRSQLLILLKTKRAFQPSPHPSDISVKVATSYSALQFAQPMSTAGLFLADISLSDDEANLFLDLAPYVNRSYYVVQDETPLNKAYTLFRTLGLRHLLVIPRAREVVGIISRKDLLPGMLEDQLSHTSPSLNATSRPIFSKHHADANFHGGEPSGHVSNGYVSERTNAGGKSMKRGLGSSRILVSEPRIPRNFIQSKRGIHER